MQAWGSTINSRHAVHALYTLQPPSTTAQPEPSVCLSRNPQLAHSHHRPRQAHLVNHDIANSLQPSRRAAAREGGACVGSGIGQASVALPA